MKLSISNFIWLSAMLLSISLVSCGEADTRDEEQEFYNQMEDSLDNANAPEIEDSLIRSDELKDNSEARKVRLSDRIRKLESDLDREISELDRKIETGTATERVKWQIRREKLALEREQLKNDLDNVGKEISTDWQQLENDIADRLDRISEDLRNDN